MAIKVQLENLKIYRYSNYKHNFELYSDEDFTMPEVISGFSAKCQFRDKPEGTVLFTATTADYLSISTQAVILEIPTAVVGAWEFNAALYDIFVISSTNKPTPIVRGSVEVYPAITQP